MNTIKVNFTIPKSLVEALRERVEERRRSAFVADAIAEKLKQMEEEQLKQALVEGYTIRREEDAEINREWEKPTLEGWG